MALRCVAVCPRQPGRVVRLDLTDVPPSQPDPTIRVLAVLDGSVALFFFFIYSCPPPPPFFFENVFHRVKFGSF
jgi:hypothetical protein